MATNLLTGETIPDVAIPTANAPVGRNLLAPATAAPSVAPTATPPPAVSNDGNWRAGDILPVEKQFTTDADGKTHDTGEWRFALPNMITGVLDAIKLPGEVMRGEVDPNSDTGFDRTMNLAMMGVSPLKGSGALSKVAGTVTTVEKLPMKVAEGVKTASKAEINIAPKPIENGPSVTEGLKPTLVDQELDAALEKILGTKKVEATATVGADKGKNFPKSKFTGTMGNESVTGTGTISGNIRGPLDVTATLGDKGIQLKLKQAERTMGAAKVGSVDDFTMQMERSYALEGMTMGDNMKAALAGRKNLISVIDDPVKAQKFAEKTAAIKSGNMPKSTLLDKIFEGWVNWGLLSGPQTHIANILSNTLVNVWDIAEHTTAAGIGKVIGSVPGIAKSGITFEEAGARALGNLEGITDALRAAGSAFRTEEDLFGGGKIEGRYQSIPGPAGRAVRLPGRSLIGADAFFKSLAYRKEINGLAIRNSLGEGLKGKLLADRVAELKTNPTAEMIASAEQKAKYDTFTNDLGDMGKKGQEFLNSHKILRFIVPFFRTPVNLVKFSLERTPVSLLAKKTLSDLGGFNGAAARDLALARVSMGSAIGAWVFHEAMKGNVTGAGPSDPGERNLWRQNNQPYSVKIGGTWYSYSRMEPLGTVLGLAADAQTLSHEMTDKEIGTMASLLTGSLARNLASKTWLQGPVSLVEALNDPERYGDQYISKMASTVIPTGLAQYAKANDPYVREAESILDSIKARIPGYRETLNARRDAMGEPIMNEGGFFKNFLSPIYTKAAAQDPTVAEMLRLGAHPGAVRHQVDGVDLLPAERDAFGNLRGHFIKQFTDATVNSPVFKELSDPMRKRLLEDNMNKATDIARSVLKAKFPDLILRSAQKKAVTAGELMAPATTPAAEASQ